MERRPVPDAVRMLQERIPDGAGIVTLYDGYWLALRLADPPPYQVTGKFLFFSEDAGLLLDIAVAEIIDHSFHHAKLNPVKPPGQSDHVLCLYYTDDSRRHELAERNRSEYHARYRYWKADTDTHAGRYSQQFLAGLPPEVRARFRRDPAG